MNPRIASPICEVPGCGFKRAMNGSRWCGAHLSRRNRTGDVQADRPVKRHVFGQYNRGKSKPAPEPGARRHFDPVDTDEL